MISKFRKKIISHLQFSTQAINQSYIYSNYSNFIHSSSQKFLFLRSLSQEDFEGVSYQKGAVNQNKENLRYQNKGSSIGERQKGSLCDGKVWYQETAVYQAWGHSIHKGAGQKASRAIPSGRCNSYKSDESDVLRKDLEYS